MKKSNQSDPNPFSIASQCPAPPSADGHSYPKSLLVLVPPAPRPHLAGVSARVLQLLHAELVDLAQQEQLLVQEGHLLLHALAGGQLGGEGQGER